MKPREAQRQAYNLIKALASSLRRLLMGLGFTVSFNVAGKAVQTAAGRRDRVNQRTRPRAAGSARSSHTLELKARLAHSSHHYNCDRDINRDTYVC